MGFKIWAKIRTGTASIEERAKIIKCIKNAPKAFRDVIDSDIYCTLVGSDELVACYLEQMKTFSDAHETKLRIRDHFPKYNLEHQLEIGKFLGQLSHLPDEKGEYQPHARNFLRHLFESRRIRAAFKELAEKNSAFATHLLDNDYYLETFATTALPILRAQIIEHKQYHYLNNDNPILQKLLVSDSCLTHIAEAAIAEDSDELANRFLAMPLLAQNQNHNHHRTTIILTRLINNKSIDLLGNPSITSDDLSELLIHLNNYHQIIFTPHQAADFIINKKFLAKEGEANRVFLQKQIERYHSDPIFIEHLLATPAEYQEQYKQVLQLTFDDDRCDAQLQLIANDAELANKALTNNLVKDIFGKQATAKLYINQLAGENEIPEEANNNIKALFPADDRQLTLYARIALDNIELAKYFFENGAANYIAVDELIVIIEHYKKQQVDCQELMTDYFKGINAENNFQEIIFHHPELLQHDLIINHIVERHKAELQQLHFIQQLPRLFENLEVSTELQAKFVNALISDNEKLQADVANCLFERVDGNAFIVNVLPQLYSYINHELLLEMLVSLAETAQRKAINIEKNNADNIADWIEESNRPEQFQEDQQAINALEKHLELLSQHNQGLFQLLLNQENDIFITRILSQRLLADKLSSKQLTDIVVRIDESKSLLSVLHNIKKYAPNIFNQLAEHAKNNRQFAESLLLKHKKMMSMHFRDMYSTVKRNASKSIIKHRIALYVNGALDKEKLLTILNTLQINLVDLAKICPTIAEQIISNKDKFIEHEILSTDAILLIEQKATSPVKNKHNIIRMDEKEIIKLEEEIAEKYKAIEAPAIGDMIVQPQPRFDERPIIDYNEINAELPSIDEFILNDIENVIEMIVIRFNHPQEEKLKAFLSKYIDDINDYFIRNIEEGKCEIVKRLFLKAPNLLQGWYSESGISFLTHNQRLSIANKLGVDFIRATELQDEQHIDVLSSIIYPLEKGKSSPQTYQLFIENLREAIKDNFCHTAVSIVLAHDDNPALLKMLFTCFKAADRNFSHMLMPKKGGMIRGFAQWLSRDAEKFRGYLKSILASNNLDNIFNALNEELIDLILHYRSNPNFIKDYVLAIIQAAANNPQLAKKLFSDDMIDLGLSSGFYMHIVEGKEKCFQQIRSAMGKNYIELFLAVKDSIPSKKQQQRIDFFDNNIQTIFDIAVNNREICLHIAQADRKYGYLQRQILDSDTEDAAEIRQLMSNKILNLNCARQKGFSNDDWSLILNLASKDSLLAIDLYKRYPKIILAPSLDTILPILQISTRLANNLTDKADIPMLVRTISGFCNIPANGLDKQPALLATLLSDQFLVKDIRKHALMSEDTLNRLAKVVLSNTEKLSDVAKLLIAVCNHEDNEIWRSLLGEELTMLGRNPVTIEILRENKEAKQLLLRSRIDFFKAHMAPIIENPIEAPPPPPPMMPPAPKDLPEKIKFNQPAGIGALLAEIRGGAHLKKVDQNKKDKDVNKPNPPMGLAEAAAARAEKSGNVDWSKVGQNNHKNKTTPEFLQKKLKKAKKGSPEYQAHHAKVHDADAVPSPALFTPRKSNVFVIPCFDKFKLNEFIRSFINIPDGDRNTPKNRAGFSIEAEVIKKNIFRLVKEALFPDMLHTVNSLQDLLLQHWDLNIQKQNYGLLNESLNKFCTEKLVDDEPLLSKNKINALNDIALQFSGEKPGAKTTLPALQDFMKKLQIPDSSELAKAIITQLLVEDDIILESYAAQNLIADFRGFFSTSIAELIKSSFSQEIHAAQRPGMDQMANALMKTINNAVTNRREAMGSDEDEENHGWSDDDADEDVIPAPGLIGGNL